MLNWTAPDKREVVLFRTAMTVLIVACAAAVAATLPVTYVYS